MNRPTALGLALLLVAAAPPPPGASSCSGCHGGALPLAGREAMQTTETLLAFRSGERPSTVMGRIAKGFDPSELGLIAAWWAAEK
ncbi:MAG: cytochrome C [Acetobacteraceae bacterium]|nr:cytochrome C [Acetobacteraceae bacterium]